MNFVSLSWVVLFQIHFVFEAARIRNDFFRILNRRPDPDPQHGLFCNVYFFPLADFCAAHPGGGRGRLRQYRRQERIPDIRDHNQRHPVRRHLRYHVSNLTTPAIKWCGSRTVDFFLRKLNLWTHERIKNWILRHINKIPSNHLISSRRIISSQTGNNFWKSPFRFLFKISNLCKNIMPMK